MAGLFNYLVFVYGLVWQGSRMWDYPVNVVEADKARAKAAKEAAARERT